MKLYDTLLSIIKLLILSGNGLKRQKLQASAYKPYCTYCNPSLIVIKALQTFVNSQTTFKYNNYSTKHQV